ncbi:ribbon-helix-helix domain-containing protein [Cryobacterium sp. N21]|uniref:ribbon-helix-helix domain-containing protein n=1 Tax=Cryobacterium sp. N21 TaxID=2048289 RepID=UPI00112515A4|nr:ribbon-helix-helix domain-containing protein [Cryobacterium sp. N21]
MNGMIKRSSVGTSFTTPKTRGAEPKDRAAGLAGLLPPRPPAPAVPESSDAAALEPKVAPALTVVPVPQPSTVTQPVASSASGGGVATIGVYLAPLTLERARETSLARRITYTDLLVEAFDFVTDAQLAAEFVPVAPLVQGKVMPTRARRRRGSAGIQMNLRLSTEQREWLDAKVQTLGAPSRSALVAEALRLHLNPSQ